MQRPAGGSPRLASSRLVGPDQTAGYTNLTFSVVSICTTRESWMMICTWP